MQPWYRLRAAAGLLPAVVAALALWLAVPTGLEGRVRCAGSLCPLLPADDARRELAFLSLQFQYQTVVRRQHLRAATVANLANSAPGVRPVDSFAVGLGSATGWTDHRTMPAAVPGSGVFADLPIRGVAARPSFVFSVNAAELLDRLGRPSLGSGWLPADRFELSLGLIRARAQDQDFLMPLDESARGGVRSRSLEVRYRLLEPSAATGRFAFPGLALLVGYRGTRSTLTIRSAPTRVSYLPLAPAGAPPLLWNMSSNVGAKTSLATAPLELRTGVRVFSHTDLYLGAGLAHHRGSGRFSNLSTGTVVSSSSAGGIVAEELSGLPVASDTALAALLSGQTKLDESRAFARIGLESGSSRVRLGFEVLADSQARAVQLSLRYLW